MQLRNKGLLLPRNKISNPENHELTLSDGSVFFLPSKNVQYTIQTNFMFCGKLLHSGGKLELTNIEYTSKGNHLCDYEYTEPQTSGSSVYEFDLNLLIICKDVELDGSHLTDRTEFVCIDGKKYYMINDDCVLKIRRNTYIIYEENKINLLRGTYLQINKVNDKLRIQIFDSYEL